MAVQATIGLLFSGGIDSSVLLADLLARGECVQPIYVAGGLSWEAEEQAAARGILDRLVSPQLCPLALLELPLADLYGDHWSVTGQQVPTRGTPDQAVYLPGRNPLLIIKARLWCQLQGISRLALGSLGTNPFPDATDDFFRAFESALDQAMLGHVELVRPFANRAKRDLIWSAADIPLDLTFSCLAPRNGLHCGVCNKCEERQQMFAAASIDDPTQYAQPCDSESRPNRVSPLSCFE